MNDFEPCGDAPHGVASNCFAMNCEGEGCALAAAKKAPPVSLDDLVTRPEGAHRDADDRTYLDLKGARERLCRAQTGINPTDSALLQGAIDRIDLVACDLPQWSRRDGGRR